MKPSVSTPSTVPSTVPRPPNRLVPPSTTAVMTASSKFTPWLADPLPSRMATSTPASAAATPTSTKTVNPTSRTSTPARRSDSRLLPRPVTYWPNGVLVNTTQPTTAMAIAITAWAGTPAIRPWPRNPTQLSFGIEIE
jgi:hypothetical protein